MCLIFLSLRSHPTYKLIIAANRDEFYNRKTEAAHFWKDFPNILGGRDLEANGTWMAMTTSGKISLLTNYRDPKNSNPNAPSRGQLVSDYLEKKGDAQTYLRNVESVGKMYNGFNLITGTVEDLWYYSNYASGIKNLTQGIHGLSNHLMDTSWPKVERGKQKFQKAIDSSAVDPKALLEFLYDSEPAPDDQLPDTGIGLERERALSSMFIKTEGYGSRCSTVVLIDQQDNVRYVERVYDLKSFKFFENEFQFKIK